MTNLRRIITRHVITLAGAALGLVLTASSAQAAIVFTVNEGAVTGANPNVFPADGITGKYEELVTCTPSPCGTGGGGSFSANIVVDFTAYTLGGGGTSDQIGTTNSPTGDVPSNEYGLYALVTVSGTYTTEVSGTGTRFVFQPTTSTADLYTDPLQNTVLQYTTATATGTVDDQHVLTATNLSPYPTSFGEVVINSSGQVVGGFYSLQYNSVSLLLPAYYPSLTGLTLIAYASGDVDRPAEGSVFPTDVKGDTSIAFDTQRVPEPASLTLLGMGLLSTGFVARRRRNKA